MKNRKVLLLDNNDSFTYNIVDYVRKMSKIELKIQETCDLKVNDIKQFDKIIISPGPGLPNDFPVLFDVLEKYYSSKKILGICLGHQAIGQFFAAKFVNISPVIHGQSHQIKIVKQSPIFNNLPKSFSVGLYHSWALDSEGFPNELEITAVSEKNVIMSLAAKKYAIYGIQYHPESFITQYGYEVLKNFVDLE
jgi:anthranilate synthase/aminodeoxychorismate synthase-like glutamine amidotransferase